MTLSVFTGLLANRLPNFQRINSVFDIVYSDELGSPLQCQQRRSHTGRDALRRLWRNAWYSQHRP